MEQKKWTKTFRDIYPILMGCIAMVAFVAMLITVIYLNSNAELRGKYSPTASPEQACLQHDISVGPCSVYFFDEAGNELEHINGEDVKLINSSSVDYPFAFDVDGNYTDSIGRSFMIVPIEMEEKTKAKAVPGGYGTYEVRIQSKDGVKLTSFYGDEVTIGLLGEQPDINEIDIDGTVFLTWELKESKIARVLMEH